MEREPKALNMLVHYSHSGIQLGNLRTIPQEAGATPYGKPRGLWVSVEGNDDGWKEWCLSENFGVENLRTVQRVHLHNQANILWIRSVDQIDLFNELYSRSARIGRAQAESDAYFFSGIDWNEVAQVYSGVIITPYMWARRLSRSTSWYYGWDCASGCIWNTAAIDRIDPGETVDLPPPVAELADV